MPMVPLPYAAAASRLAGLLDASASTDPRGDPAPLGIRALLSALAPYAATSSIFIDAAAASRAALVGASVIGDLLSYVAPRLPLLNAAVIPRDASFTTTLGALLPSPVSGIGAPRHLLVNTAAVSGIGASRLPLLNAAVIPRDASSTTTLGALLPSPVSGVGAPRHLLVNTAAVPGIGAPRHLLVSTAAAGIGAPRHLLVSTAAATFDPFTTTAPCGLLVILNAAAASPFAVSDSVSDSATIALAAPYAAGMRTVSRHLNSAATLQRPFFFLTRSVSTTTTTGPNQVSSVAGARIFRQLNKKRQATRVRPAAGATRVRREAGLLESLDVTLRDMGYITRGPFARLFVLFTVFTIMSEGVRECKLRFGQLSLALSSLRDEGEVQEGSEGWIQLVSIMGEDFGWLFE